jgi:hypothetical protein
MEFFHAMEANMRAKMASGAPPVKAFVPPGHGAMGGGGVGQMTPEFTE